MKVTTIKSNVVIPGNHKKNFFEIYYYYFLLLFRTFDSHNFYKWKYEIKLVLWRSGLKLKINLAVRSWHSKLKRTLWHATNGPIESSRPHLMTSLLTAVNQVSLVLSAFSLGGWWCRVIPRSKDCCIKNREMLKLLFSAHSSVKLNNLYSKSSLT